MNLSEYTRHDATGLARMVRNRETSPGELISLARAAYEAVNPEINAVIEFYADAEEGDGPDHGAFAGVPFLRKDVGATEQGRLQEAGSRLLKGNVAAADSYFIRRIKAAGLCIVGRTAVPEFAISGFTETLLNGVTGNPWNPSRTAGGSSGGAAAAVAAGIVPLAHASDGGGSTRIPAGWCGTVGLNPTRGRVSGGPNRQDPLFGLAREFVVCRSVRDMAAMLDILSGPEPADPFIIVPPDRPYAEELARPVGKLRIGVARTAWGDEPIAADVLAVLDRVALSMQDAGHQTEEIIAPVDRDDLVTGVMGAFNLALADLPETARALGRPLDETTLEPVTLKLLDRVLSMSAPDITHIFESLRRVRCQVAQATAEFDVLLTPTLPITAPGHGRFATTRGDLSLEDFLKGDTNIFTFLSTFNATGQPSVSLPVGESDEGMPIGVQFVGRFADEATLVRLARDVEEAFPWQDRLPLIHAARSQV